MLAGCLALLILVIRLFPETPLAQLLHRVLVERPLDLAGRLERRHLILVAIILCTGHLAVALGSAELALAYAVDLSIYADAVLVTTLASAAARFRNACWTVKNRIAGMIAIASRGWPRSRRTAPAAGRRPPASNDDEPDWARRAQAA